MSRANGGPSDASSVWRPFFWTAIVLATVVGFGLGGALFAAPALGMPTGPWWAASAQVHGHVQLFGWAGLMVLGIGFHFLPRLRGRALAYPGSAQAVLWLLTIGLILRTLCQPLLAGRDPNGGADSLLGAGLALSGVLEFAGVSVALGLLLATARGDPPLRARPGLPDALPFLLVAFVGLWLALLANLAAVFGAGGDAVDRVVVLVGMYGFLVPICVGMGVRLFPLHYAARLPNLPVLRAALATLLVGLAARLAGESLAVDLLRAAGLLLLAVALVLSVVGLRVFGRRRVVPGGRTAWYRDAAQWHGLTAHAWLATNAALLAMAGVGILAPGLGQAPLRLETHLLGTGFVTLLILGEGVNLLPGFARRPLRGQSLVWATLALGNLAVILRVGPVLLPEVFGVAARPALAASGFVGLLAILLFALNLTGARSARV